MTHFTTTQDVVDGLQERLIFDIIVGEDERDALALMTRDPAEQKSETFVMTDLQRKILDQLSIHFVKSKFLVSIRFISIKLLDKQN